MPVALNIDKNRPHIAVINTGVLRCDVFKGPFTQNDQLSASSYADKFCYIPDVDFDLANSLASKLNELKKRSILCGRGNNDARSAVWPEMSSANVDQQVVLADGETLGYVTHDVSDYSLQDGQL